MHKTDGATNLFNTLSALMGGMALIDLIPWFLGLLFVISAIVVNVAGYTTKRSEHRVNRLEEERKQLEIRKLKRELGEEEDS